MYRILLINGKRMIEWPRGEPQPICGGNGPQTHYRDGNGDVRVYGSDKTGNPIVVAKVIEVIH